MFKLNWTLAADRTNSISYLESSFLTAHGVRFRPLVKGSEDLGYEGGTILVPRGRDPRNWPKGSRPLGTRMGWNELYTRGSHLFSSPRAAILLDKKGWGREWASFFCSQWPGICHPRGSHWSAELPRAGTVHFFTFSPTNSYNSPIAMPSHYSRVISMKYHLVIPRAALNTGICNPDLLVLRTTTGPGCPKPD